MASLPSLKELKFYFAPYRLAVYLGLFCLLLTNLGQNFIPLLLKHSIDELKQQNQDWKSLRWFLAGIVVLAILQATFRILSRLLIFNAARKVEYQLRNDLFAHLQKLPMTYFNQMSVGQIMAMLNNDLTYVRMLYAVGTVQVTNAFMSYCFALVALFQMQWRLSFMVVVIFPLVFWAGQRLVKKIFKLSKENQEIFGDLSDRLHESLSGVRALKTYNATEYSESLLKDTSQTYLESNLKLTNYRLLFAELMDVGAGFGMSLILAYGGLLVCHQRLTLGELVAFTAYLAILSWPTKMMGWVIPAVQRGLTAFVRVQEVLKTPPEPGYELTIPPAIANRISNENYDASAIELRDVSFTYETSTPALQHLTLKIPGGSKVLITGPIGSGKTTLLKLLSGLYLPTSGETVIGKLPLIPENLLKIRSFTSYCPQDAFVFSRSLEDNILFATNHSRSLIEAAELASLDNDLEQFPQGWETMVGEKGVTLSGGQRQRTALARAIAKPSQILLLDDPIAQLDGRTALKVWQGLIRQNPQHTILLVSQRLMLPESFDLILMLKNGKIIEQGKHQQLIKNQGLYKNYYDLQQLLFQEEA